MPAHLPLGAGLLLVAVMVGCTFDPTVTTGEVAPTPEALRTLEEVSGRWRMQSVVSAGCPEGLGAPPFQGQTRWSVEGSLLTITHAFSHQPPLALEALTEDTFGRSFTLTEWGCEVATDITLVLGMKRDRYLSGSYEIRYMVRGGVECEALAAQHGMPARCEVSADWEAHRIGPK